MGNLMNLPHAALVGTDIDTNPPEFGGLIQASHIFCRVYNNHWGSDIRKLMALPTLADRIVEAKRLASDPAVLIDREIMVEGGSGRSPLTCAYGVMANRIANGFYWVPALWPGDFDVDPDAAKFDHTPYQDAVVQPPHALRVSIRPQNFPQHVDFAALPKPFRWRLEGPVDGGVGAIYLADNQLDHEGYQATWPDPVTGWLYEKIYTTAWGYKIVKWKRIK